jgi:hypothetical protein
MSSFSFWSRRQFLARSAATAIVSACGPDILAQAAPKPLQSAASSPEEIAGGIRPLLLENTARPLRYTPDGGDFLIHNGKEFFNRPLYGPNNAFRIDAGDLPEFSLYLPGHGGNLRLGIFTSAGSRWLFQAANVITRYRPSRMLYEIQDPLLGSGTLDLEVFTAGEGSGLHLRAQASNTPIDLSLFWAFGGVSGRKGKRGGDIGCESESVSTFFHLRPEECSNNDYKINRSASSASSPTESYASANLQSHAASLLLLFPAGANLRIADASAWDTDWPQLNRSATTPTPHPVLIGSAPIALSIPLYLHIRRLTGKEDDQQHLAEIPSSFTTRSEQLKTTAAAVQTNTPDTYLDASVAALNIAADAIWDAAAQCVMHGAVAWRVPLAGWRGPYALTSLGQHTRLQQHLRHWIARQNTTPLSSNELPATGAPDPGSHLTRKENLLHRRGDLSHNHYDMNLVFFDVLLRHLCWTGDLDFAREIWPALVLHLEWERRLFRRTYTAGDQKLPLYEAYACIWASDNLQYNGGGAAHSTAYNYYANRSAATLAHLLGEDATAYENEAALIHQGMQQLLWLPEQGTFGESKDILGPQTVYTSPAVWTLYHTIDSEVPTPRQAWQMAAERLAALKRVPVHGPDVPAENNFMLSCSDWLPYIWSLNLLVLAENMHTALALWQAGLSEEAFQLFKGNLLDSMFQGLCPGNFHMSSELDVHRQESQRDFGDPIGITSRALVEGLFGLKPDLLHNRLTLRPGFPSDWSHAGLHHPDLDLAWRRENLHDSFDITSRFPKPVALTLLLPARHTGNPTVTINGISTKATFDPEAVGIPTLSISSPPSPHWKIEVTWQGKAIPHPPTPRVYKSGEPFVLPPSIHASQIDDPQQALSHGHVSRPGFHTVFVRMHQEACKWWMPISFETKSAATPAPVRHPTSHSHIEPIDLSAKLQHNITDIFQRSYVEPRSPYCSLAIPQQGAGAWAAFDIQPTIDDSGLRSSGGTLQTPIGVSFLTPSARTEPNCLFLSHWQQDKPSIQIPLTRNATSLFLLLAGTTFPQCSRMTHGVVTVHYTDGSFSNLALRNPDNWWPIEQDYLLDDYLFVDPAPIPPRVDLRSGLTRVLDPVTFRGQGRAVPGGAANILELPLDPKKSLSSLQIEAKLYGIVISLLGATLVRPS